MPYLPFCNYNVIFATLLMRYNRNRKFKKGEFQMKKVLSLVTALVLLLGTIPVSAAPSENSLYEEAGKILKNLGVLQGSESGDLMLDQKLKRQDMVVLISRLYNEEDIASKYPVKTIFTDIKDDFYKPYIYWAVDKGLIQGTAPNTFGYTTNDSTKYDTKVQQLQAVLLRALGYGSEVNESYDSVPKLAESKGIMKGLSVDKNDTVTRGLMAAMTLNALKTNINGYTNYTLADKLKLKIPGILVEVNPLIYANTLVFEGVAQGTDELKLVLKSLSDESSFSERFYNVELKEDGRFEITIENLEGGKYEYRFTIGSLTIKSGTVEIKDLPFELSDITASNLKEISLSFTQPVDVETSQFTSKYFTDAGTIKAIRFENSNKTVKITLNETMTNQNTYKISVSSIKSEKGDEISIYNREFKVFDNTPPEVKEVVQLGNKGLKIIASEPIKTAKADNFKIDGKSVKGQVSVNDNVITLIYSSTYYAPGEGTHTLNASGLLDYANFPSMDRNLSFKVVKDTAPPEVVSVSATTEEAIIQFDEDIDPDSIVKTNFYWKSGSSKKYPANIKAAENKLFLDFSSNKLPTSEVTISINKVRDYSGNTLNNEEVKVKPILDTTAPEVVGLDVSNDGKTITVYFSKNVKGNNRNSYDLRDERNNRIPIGRIEGSGRVFKIILANPLPAGTNTITIDNIVDTTALENRLIPYRQEIFMKDVEVPRITSYAGKDNMILLRFSKEMDIDTVFNTSNYVIKFNNQYAYLPEETDFSPLEDDLTYILYLPSEIDGKKVEIGKSGNLVELDIRGLKGVNGVMMNPVTLTFDSTTDGKANMKSAELVEPGTIVVAFDQPIVDASASDFSIPGMTIIDVYVDFSEKVVLYLYEENKTYIEGSLTIKTTNSIETHLGANAKASSIGIVDRVPPRIDAESGELTLTGRYIYLPFTEKLKKEIDMLYKEDLIIEVLGEGILDKSKYSTELDTTGTKIRIKIANDVNISNGLIVRLVDNPKYIMDNMGNIVQYDGNKYYTD